MKLGFQRRIRPSTRPRFHLLALVAVLLFAATTGLAGASNPSLLEPSHYTLAVGDEVFWDGEFVDYANVYDPSKCNTHLGPCWEYRLDVKEQGWRLRVAINLVFENASYTRWWSDYLNFNSGTFSQDSIFNVQLYDPSGNLYHDPNHAPEGGNSRDTITTDYGYSRETFVANPAVGTWKIRVIPVRVQHMGFKMRAKLESQPAAPGEQSVLNPNLRIIPPFEVNFNTPTHTYGPSTPNTDGTAPSCMEEEWVEADEHGDHMTGQCLRVSAGIENVGAGPLLLMATCNDYPYLSHPECKEATEPLPEGTVQMYQRRLTQNADGTTTCCVEEPVGSAGYAEYHDFHGHFHYEDVYVYELYRVTDPDWDWNSKQKPAMEFTSTSEKRGFWPWDERMADWHEFYQVPQDSNMADATLRIGSGWGDAYEYNRGGQFMPFPVDSQGLPQAGYYLIRGTADISDKLIESDETDNVGYTFIEVGTGGAGVVTTLERGYGTDPWDPAKEVVVGTP